MDLSQELPFYTEDVKEARGVKIPFGFLFYSLLGVIFVITFLSSNDFAEHGLDSFTIPIIAMFVLIFILPCVSVFLVLIKRDGSLVQFMNMSEGKELLMRGTLLRREVRRFEADLMHAQEFCKRFQDGKIDSDVQAKLEEKKGLLEMKIHNLHHAQRRILDTLYSKRNKPNPWDVNELRHTIP